MHDGLYGSRVRSNRHVTLASRKDRTHELQDEVRRDCCSPDPQYDCHTESYRDCPYSENGKELYQSVPGGRAKRLRLLAWHRMADSNPCHSPATCFADHLAVYAFAFLTEALRTKTSGHRLRRS